MATPHKHAALIKAWADGAEIEYQNDLNGQWRPIATPYWHPDTKFRIRNKWQHVIDAHAAGKAIEYRYRNGSWSPTVTLPGPKPHPDYEFRIKPEPPAKVFAGWKPIIEPGSHKCGRHRTVQRVTRWEAIYV